MGRYVSLAIDPVVNFGARDVKPGFGSGAFRFFGSSGTFLIPTGVSEVRVTALGGGGTGGFPYGGCPCRCYCAGAGGGGAGYVVATTSVTPGCTCNIAVGGAGGGTSCFGTAIYAYGGGNATGTCGVTAGTGGTYCVCSGNLVSGRNGNAGCNSCDYSGYIYSNCFKMCGGPGGASGSPIGGGGTGPFPGTSGSDIYSCKGFNGENVDEATLASKFSNTIRWPGETVISTSRCGTTIAGTAAGYPIGCYAVSAYGGASVQQACSSTCPTCLNAGCGGGGAGGHGYGGIICYCNYGYGQTCYIFGGQPCSGSAGAGYVVVEY